MVIVLVRVCILYVLILVSMRLMGRRQIGELQPSELVVTILISEIACVPIQDNGVPILNSIAAVLVLTAFEILFSALSLKSDRVRRLLQGNPIAVIRDGKIDQNALKELRVTLDDLLEALREKDVFNPADASFAILESNGKLSVLPQPSPANGLVCPVVYDGKVQKENYPLCDLTDAKMDALLLQCGIPLPQIFLMTADKKGIVQCIRKETGS